MSDEHKIALVTGASRGIGQAIAIQLAKQGHMILGTATTEEGAAKITAYFEGQGIAGRGYVLDVAKKESIEHLMQTLTSDHLLPDILVNNAGITRDNLLLRMKDDEWEQVIQTNLGSIFYLSKACLKSMLKKRWGRIINIASVVAFIGNPGQGNYCAAKAGIIGFTRSIAKEIASRQITCNAVAPGFIETDMTAGQLDEAQKETILQSIPMGRMGRVEDIAYMVNFLASSQAEYITGETFHVNGGMYVA